MNLVMNKEKLKQIQEKRNLDKQYTILIVDDEAANLDSLTMLLESKYNVIAAHSGLEALSIIQNHPNPENINLIISDQRMPKMTGVDFLKLTLPIIPKAIRIILTGHSDINDTIDSINEGKVYKFLTKPIEPRYLMISLQRALEAYELEKQNILLINQLKVMNENLEHLVEERTAQLEQSYLIMKKQKEELEYLSNFQDTLVNELEVLSITDPLTGLANRRWLESYLKEECEKSLRSKRDISVIMLDIDHFKLFNDFYGHANGDKCIKTIADVMKRVIRAKSGLAARYGGEEFCCVLSETRLEDACLFAEGILSELKKEELPHERSNTSDHVTISVGVYSGLPEDSGDSWKDLIKQADKYLYDAKENGRNQFCSNYKLVN